MPAVGIFYSNQAFEGPDDPKVFEESAPIIIPMEALSPFGGFLEENRPTEAGTRKQNNGVANGEASFRSYFYVTEKVVSILTSGYIATNKIPEKSKFEFGPMNTYISGNAIEGARFRVGGTTTTAFSKRLSWMVIWLMDRKTAS